MPLARLLEQPARPGRMPGRLFSRTLRHAAAVAACVFLALPIGYLAVRHAMPLEVLAQSRPQPEPAGSIAQLEAAVRANPAENNRLRLSWAYLQDHQAGRAIPLLLSIVAEDRNNADAWNNLCVAHTMLMSYNLADEECGNALRIQPGFQLARNNLNWADGEFQKTQKAIAVEEQTAPASRDANFYLAEGLNFLHIGGYGQAIKAWRRALDLNPKDALAANNIGVAYMQKKQPAQAVSWFQKAISIDPTMRLAKNNLAWALNETIKTLKNKAAK
ncbi:MAG: tetratricopeptide repeat protein [Terracidiphilus sp.]